MKRVAALVDYPASDDDDDAQNAAQPQTKKVRKLPSLPTHLLPNTPIDNPALHQGRRRTAPHVEGQFAAHVYVPLIISKRTKLFHLFRRIFATANELVPSLHPIGPLYASDPSSPATSPSASDDDPLELHISLTRPTYLRAHQRDDFKRAVQSVARSRHKFTASLVTISELTNDERTRTFLTLEVGAGHDQFRSLAEGLTPALRSIRQKEFYEYPRFHASLAWALLDQTPPSPTSSPRDPSPADSTAVARPSPSAGDAVAFPTIPSFPPSLIPHLRAQYDGELVQSGVGVFEVDELRVRIGKQVSKWRLAVEVLADN